MQALNAKDEVNANMFTEWRQNLQETRGPRNLPNGGWEHQGRLIESKRTKYNSLNKTAGKFELTQQTLKQRPREQQKNLTSVVR